MAAVDNFSQFTRGASGPVNGAVAVTPDNSNDLTNTTRGIYVGGAGNIKVDMADGTTVTFTAIAIGIVHPLRVKRVYATGTTATTILALY
jgi:hypothetical protein